MGQVYWMRPELKKAYVGWYALMVDARGTVRMKVWRPTLNWATSAAQAAYNRYLYS